MPRDFRRTSAAAKKVSYGVIGALWQVTTGFLYFRLRIIQRLDRTVGSPDLVFRVARVADLPWQERAQTRIWLAAAHGWRTRWAAFDWYIEAEDSGRRVAIAGVVDRVGRVAETPMHLALIGGVFTHPRYRGSGIATELMQRCTLLGFDVLGCDVCVLICADELVNFYEKRGWTRADRELVFERFGQRQVANINVMIWCRSQLELPAGRIDVMGLPA